MAKITAGKIDLHHILLLIFKFANFIECFIPRYLLKMTLPVYVRRIGNIILHQNRRVDHIALLLSRASYANVWSLRPLTARTLPFSTILHCTVIRAVMLASVIHNAFSHLRTSQFRVLRMRLKRYSMYYKVSSFYLNRVLASTVMGINVTNISQ